MDFESSISNWYVTNKRNLPWRNSTNPYFIWLSEVILQQTRVAQGMAYYTRFIAKFPTVKTLAESSETEVLKLWEGLGYYSRARNLHAGAKQVVNNFDGKLPTDYNRLLTLKGIGPYTAAAIASICFGQRVAVVDGNVYRVLSRIYGISTPINSTAGKKEFDALAQKLIASTAEPGMYNQAVMEFGALHCTPKNPDCASCIFAAQCVAYATNSVEKLPVKIKSKPVKHRYFTFLVAVKNDRVAIMQRSTTEIWAGLYQFPLDESSDSLPNVAENDLLAPPITHLLSHQKLHIQFKKATPKEVAQTSPQWATAAQISSLPFPIVLKRFIATNLLPLLQ